MYSIPFSDNYKLTDDCEIVHIVNDEAIIIKPNRKGLYKITYKNKPYTSVISDIICSVFYGYNPPDKIQSTYSRSNPISGSHYLIDSVIRQNGYILINGIMFRQSPRWDWLYGNAYGSIFDTQRMRFRRQKQDKDGYSRFSPTHEVSNFAVHRFIYECWNNVIITPDVVIHHKDSVKINNSIQNLELTTFEMNTRYSIILHEKKLDRYYTEADIHKMCQMMQDGSTYREIAKEFGIDPTDEREYKKIRSRLNLLLQKKSAWTDISSQYNFDGYTGNEDPNKKFTSDEIIDMHVRYWRGEDLSSIAKIYDTPRKYVRAVVTGRKRMKEYVQFHKRLNDYRKGITGETPVRVTE